MHLHRYIEQLESQGGNAKFPFSNFKADLQSREVVKLWKLDEATSFDNAMSVMFD